MYELGNVEFELLLKYEDVFKKDRPDIINEIRT